MLYCFTVLLYVTGLLLAYRWMDGSQVVFEMWDKDNPKFTHYDETCVFIHNGEYHFHQEIKLYLLIKYQRKCTTLKKQIIMHLFLTFDLVHSILEE